jgi:SAM-dependent methyltransferase
MSERTPSAVSAHYQSVPELARHLLDALRAAGQDLDHLTPDGLAPVDQFHTAGRAATRELAQRAKVQPGSRVLDIGGGIGGPARTLAAEFGCSVTVLDFTETFCQTGELFTERVGLSDRVGFQHGDALAMPFADATFDVAWTQHSSMNIPDKDRLYREIHRVLRPGGRLALHEIMAGPIQPVHFPVPWAREPTISFLRTPQEIRALLAEFGFVEVEWEDTTDRSLAWFRAWTNRPAALSDRQPLGLHLLLGPDFPTMGQNQVRNLEEGRIAVIEAVFDRP